MNTDLIPADLAHDDLEVLTSLEEQIGAPVVAYQPASPFARLTDDQLAALRDTERRLGVQLLAYAG
jgi:hypothetical protein